MGWVGSAQLCLTSESQKGVFLRSSSELVMELSLNECSAPSLVLPDTESGLMEVEELSSMVSSSSVVMRKGTLRPTRFMIFRLSSSSLIAAMVTRPFLKGRFTHGEITGFC